jgi:hypothetical protein
VSYVFCVATTSMPRLSDEALRQRLRKLRKLWDLRAQGTLSEDQIAQELGFTDGSGAPSARVMYERLQEDWDLPNWLTKPDDMSESIETIKERKASTSGEVKELPAAGQAEALFRADLKRLTSYLDEISELKEHLQGKLYASFSWVGEDWEEHWREEYTEDDWKRVCQDFDEDPAQEAFRIPISPYIHHGAGPTPWKGLTLLIVLHTLMHERGVDYLLSALHPDPASVNLAELHKVKKKDGAAQNGVVTELKRAAAKLAVIVRGGEVKRGKKGEVVPFYEVRIALAVGSLTKEGFSAEEIIHQLKECRLLAEQGRYYVWPEHEELARKEKYTIDDLKRHQELDLSPPD